MAYRVTIDDQDFDKPFEITDTTEIVPLYDIEPEEAAFALGLPPSHALLYYMAFQWSPFDTVLELLDMNLGLFYMTDCLQHVWPLVNEYMPEERAIASDTIAAARLAVNDPQLVVSDPALAKTLLVGPDLFDKIAALPKDVRGRYVMRAGADRPRRIQKTAEKNMVVRSVLASAFKSLVVRLRSCLRSQLGDDGEPIDPRRRKSPTAMQTLGVLKDAYQVTKHCRRAVEITGGNIEKEEEWQILRIFRLFLGPFDRRFFSYKVQYEHGDSADLSQYFNMLVSGRIEEL